MKPTRIVLPLLATLGMLSNAQADQPAGASKVSPGAARTLSPQSPGGPAPLVGGSDSCTTPDIISGNGPFLYDTTAATTGTQGQSNSRCYIFNTAGVTFDVWYQWTAAATGWTAVSLCTGGTHDSKVAVYAGAGCPTGEPLVCDDDGCGVLGASSLAPFFATAGNVYTIQLGSYPGQAGSIGSFSMVPFTPGPGDDCAAPNLISGVGTFNYDSTSATSGLEGQHEALCSGEMITYDTWFTWVSTCTGTITVSMCAGSSFDNKLAVYNGAGCPTGSALACDDDGCGVGGGPSIITFNAVAGNVYTLQVGMWPGEVPGAGSFNISTPCPTSVGTPYCFGDGTGTACPCANNGALGHGCANSVNAQGGLLGAFGNASIANDTVVLQGSSMPNSSCLYFQGTSQISNAFGDGLRCAGGQVIRLGTKSNVNGSSQYPVAGDPSVSVRGAVTVPGTTRDYQVWYRNAAAFCTASTFNLSNGLSITWN